MKRDQPNTLTSDGLFQQASAAWDQGELTLAFELFQESAMMGNSGSQHNIGYFLERGIGVRKNVPKAILWYKRAARMGSVSSYGNIGIIYQELSNFARARYWLEKAIRAGDGDAALQLARLYLGTNKRNSKANAFKFLKIALTSRTVTQDSLEEARLLMKTHDLIRRNLR